MTPVTVCAILGWLLAMYAAKLIADGCRDKRAKAEAENKRQHDERMALMPAGGAE